jgi:hypothetical protein
MVGMKVVRPGSWGLWNNWPESPVKHSDWLDRAEARGLSVAPASWDHIARAVLVSGDRIFAKVEDLDDTRHWAIDL